MTPQEQLQQMIDEGKLIKAHQDTALNVYDAIVEGKDYVIFHALGHDKEMDVSVSVHVGKDAKQVRELALDLLAWADKYDPQPTMVEVQQVAEKETKEPKKAKNVKKDK